MATRSVAFTCQRRACVGPLARSLHESAEGTAKVERRRKKKIRIDPLTPPPPAADFPTWAYDKRDFFHYELVYQSKKSLARVGRIHTPHGIVNTPGFVSVGTNGALKAVDHRAADEAGCELMFMNTYHLLVQPGPELVDKMGGLHKFVSRDRPIITDSGGFQLFSLSYGSVEDELNMKSRSGRHGWTNTVMKVEEEGASFRSYRDGRLIKLTPETTVQAQKAYRSDIIIPLDELPPYHITPERLKQSVFLSHRWEARSLKEHLKDIRQQAMYCVVHGGSDRQLRAHSLSYLSSLPFDGFAIGGSLGKDQDELIEILDFVMPKVPRDKPCHLLGIADVGAIERSILLGVDTFDSCYPTRIARHGTILTSDGKISIKQISTLLAALTPSRTCKNYSRSYLNHLIKAHEPVAATLLTIHNLTQMNIKMSNLRQKILDGQL